MISEYLLDKLIASLRDSYDVIIYNAMEPFVDPQTHHILYRYKVKWCNKRDGWNGRIIIGTSDLTDNVIHAKEQAVKLALCWVADKGKGPQPLISFIKELFEEWEQEPNHV